MRNIVQEQVKLALARSIADRVSAKLAAEAAVPGTPGTVKPPVKPATGTDTTPTTSTPAPAPATPAPAPVPPTPKTPDPAAVTPAAPKPASPAAPPAPTPGLSPFTPMDIVNPFGAVTRRAAEVIGSQMANRAQSAPPAAQDGAKAPEVPGAQERPSTVQGSTATAVEQAQTPEETKKLLEQVKPGVESYVTNEAAEIAKAVVNNPAGSGFGDWVTANWQNFLIPAGVIAFALGGTIGGKPGDIIGKTLGLLAVGYGGYDLYKRYTNLTEDPSQVADPVRKSELQDIQAAMKLAVQQQDDQNRRTPFLNPEQAYQDLVAKSGGDPAVLQRLEKHKATILQAIRDTRLIAGMGFTEQITKRIQQGVPGVVDEKMKELEADPTSLRMVASMMPATTAAPEPAQKAP